MRYTVYYTTARRQDWQTVTIWADDPADAVKTFVSRRDLCPADVRKVRAA